MIGENPSKTPTKASSGERKSPRRKPRVSAKLYLTASDLERGMVIGAKVDREENPTMLVYYDPSVIRENPR